jgi:head-tail adaptor
MPKENNSAGRLYEKIAFDRREQNNPDSPSDFGNSVSDWQEQFQCRAAFIHLRGGESVMSGRLAGKHSVVFQVRSSTNTRLITTEWRARDVRKGTQYNVRDITPSTDRMYLDILAESGVAI